MIINKETTFVKELGNTGLFLLRIMKDYMQKLHNLFVPSAYGASTAMHIVNKIGILGLLFFMPPLYSMHLYKSITKVIATLVPTSLLWHHYYNAHTHKEEERNLHSNTHMKRPQNVQKRIDENFEGIKDERYWGLFNGQECYEPLGIDEEVLVKKLIASGKKDIYVMDAGCGRGHWGHNIKEILEKNHKNSKVRFHIFSITGGEECQEETIKTGNVTLYQLNQLKIENIDEELVKRNFDLKNKFDIIVSRWALRHMVDPLGTVDRLYGLLNPAGGKLASNGFFFKLDTSETHIAFPNDHPHILTNSNASTLFCEYDLARSMDQFLLERNNKKPLGLPLEYTGSIGNIPSYFAQCDSGNLTEFQLTKTIGDTPPIEKLNNEKSRYRREHYCVQGDKQCKELYTRLKKQGFFDSPKAEKKCAEEDSEHWFIAQ